MFRLDRAKIRSAIRFAVPFGLVGSYLVGSYLSQKYWHEPKVKPAKPEPKIVVESKPGLNANEFRTFKVTAVKPYNHDTQIYTLAVPDAELPVSSLILAKANVEGKDVVRPYTPLSGSTADGLELLVKSYPKGELSKHFATLKVGDEVELKGPMMKFDYKPNMKKEIGMLAGGTGITPMLQVINKIVSDPEDHTKVSLIFCNLTEDDILVKERLDRIAEEHSNVKITYMVDKNLTNDWPGRVGLINKDIIRQTMPSPSDDNLILVCGPPGFVKAVSGPKGKNYTQGDLKGILGQLGYSKSNVFKY